MGFFEDIGAFIGEAKDIASELGSVGKGVKTSVTESAAEIGETLTSAATEISSTVEESGNFIKETVDTTDTQK